MREENGTSNGLTNGNICDDETANFVVQDNNNKNKHSGNLIDRFII